MNPLLQRTSEAPDLGRNGWYAAAGKRVLDLMLAGAGLILAAVPLLLCGLLIRLTSPGPVLYFQDRVGRGGRIFRMCKLRTMRVDAEAERGPCFAVLADARVTPVGRILRALRVDEAPQLWNVLRGDMSLVGPRPERPCFVTTFAHHIAGYAARHHVRPGLTGWAQIHHGYCSTLAQTRAKTALDLAYLQHLSLTLDLRILARTPPALVRYVRREFHWTTAVARCAMAAESFPAGGRSQAKRPRTSAGRPAIGNPASRDWVLFPRRTEDGAVSQGSPRSRERNRGAGERGAKPRAKAALPHGEPQHLSRKEDLS